ncbi:hypothetical protein F5050DRAFT_1852580 [Lentinula boryana]|uniref:Uncharacterized protein n=1 Tax=Lentinula boryana TaxID=40481 RepID=A0ABQ8Q2J3_9AGAR|nr:hypothetical protein F5050DRAFT_1852580 [Lentinula boryana]
MSLLWSLWMISTAQAVPFPVNAIQPGMMTDGNNDHLDAYAVWDDSSALVARGKNPSKVKGDSSSGSTSSKKAVFYYFDCESDEFLNKANRKSRYLHKGKSSLEGHTIIELIHLQWHLMQLHGFWNQTQGNPTFTELELSYRGLNVLNLNTESNGPEVLSKSRDIDVNTRSHRGLSKDLNRLKQRLDTYDVIIFALIPISDSTPPSSQTYAALMNSKATKAAGQHYVLHVTSDDAEDAWKEMQIEEGQVIEATHGTGDWTDEEGDDGSSHDNIPT